MNNSNNNIIETFDEYVASKRAELNENYDWDAIVLGLGIVASSITEDNNYALVYNYFDEEHVDDEESKEERRRKLIAKLQPCSEKN